MMDRYLRLASIVLVAAGLAACEDDETTTPDGETSTVNVSVYIEDDGEAGLTAGDTPIEGASVTLTPNDEDDETLTGTTGANGIATFTEVSDGVYTLTHTPATPITDATLTGPTTQTVVAQFEGGTTNAEFVYSFNPGSISGVFFRDEDDNDEFDADLDTTLAGFQAILFAGDDTTATEVDAVTVGDDGAFEFTGLAQGDYTILVRPIPGATVADSTVSVTVTPGDETVVNIEFEGGQAIIDIAEARDLPVGTTVTVEGVVTAGTGVYSSTNFYMQDATAGIIVFIGSGGPSIDLAIGDSVRVSGVRGAFSAEEQIAGGAAMEVEILGTGTIPAPRTVTVDEINAGDFQGELATVTGLTVDSLEAGANWDAFTLQGTDSLVVFFDADVGVTQDMIVEGGVYNMTGIVTTFVSSGDTIREIKPRSLADVELTSSPGGTIDIAVARTLDDGDTVSVTGVVTAEPGTYNATSLYIQDASGGITLFTGSGGPDVSALVVGDSVNVTGVMGTFSAERQIAGGASLTVTDVGDGTVPAAQAVDAADVNAARFQGELAVADSVMVVSVSVSGSGNVTAVVADEAGEFTVFGDVDTGITGANLVEGQSYMITGVLASFQSGSNPPLFQIKPRSTADIVGL